MKAEELRIGNYINYHIVDSMDERGEYDEISKIDHDDIRVLCTYDDNSEYQPIPLTEERLQKFGFEVQHGTPNNSKAIYADFEAKFQILRIYLADESVQLPCTIHVDCNDWFPKIAELRYVHQLQNLYYALTGNELTIS